jgi:hypothetical protein
MCITSTSGRKYLFPKQTNGITQANVVNYTTILIPRITATSLNKNCLITTTIILDALVTWDHTQTALTILT